MRQPLRLAILTAVLLTGLPATACGSAAPEPPPSATGADPSPRVSHVHAVDLNPADGMIYVAAHEGLYRVGAAGGLERVGATGRDLMGFAIAAPDTFLSSGHPGPTENAPDPLGLVRSTDAGATWQPVSLAGEVDFHALQLSSGTLYGLDAGRRTLRVSSDGGTTWQLRATVAALDIAVDPTDPATVLATTADGVVASRDGGASFGAPTGPQLAFLSWAPDATLYGLAPDGALHTSVDAGANWRRVGVVPGGHAQAVTGLADGRVLAATTGGLFDSRDGGRTFVPLGRPPQGS
ncbi:F510_1955 family glycosylhydrolase [Pseudonocardia hispaniensis]|uniref:F510_1955 family glycosylhydrolase n=1 Tax=Pseudonocardia hispaniensis TaxID=904933 RepID=A0ABW1IXQ6_9PSEU